MARKNSIENDRIISKGGSLAKPTTNQNEYNHSLSEALNYYNANWSLAEYKQSAIEYGLSIGIKISTGIPEYKFRGVGAICDLIMRNCFIASDDMKKIKSKLVEIQSEYVSSKSDTEPQEVVQVQSIKLIDNLVVDYLNSIDDILIQSTLDGDKPSIDKYVTEYVSNEYTKSQAKVVMNFIDRQIKYYKDSYNNIKSDEDIKDSWSHIPQIRLKNVYKILESLYEGLSSAQVKEKVSIVKTKKVLSPIIQTKDLPYLSEYKNIKGIHPSKVIGNSEIWLFDTQTRDIHVLKSIKDTKISAKGSSFVNIDVDLSYKKKLRKEDDIYLFTNTLETPTKKTLASTFKSIKTTQQPSTNRMNINKIIIHTFK